MSENSETPANTKAWPKGIFAITLFTEDLELSKEFYQKVFGLPIDYEDPNSAVFKFGDTLVNLLKITEADELIKPAKVANRELEPALCSRSWLRMWMRCVPIWSVVE